MEQSNQMYDLGAGDPKNLEFLAKHLSAVPLPKSAAALAPVVFSPSVTPVPGMRIEYAITDNRVRFHVFPLVPNAVWSPRAEEKLRLGFTSVAPFIHALDYVPEMDSWYVELRDLPVQLTDALVESLIGKVAAA